MSLNNIELGSFLVTELYRDNLLATEGSPALTRSPVASPSASPVAPAAASEQPSVPRTSSAEPTTTATAPGPAAAPIPEAKTPAAPTPSGSSVAPVISAPVAASVPRSGDSVPDPGYKVLGNNRRKITVLVDSPGVAFLPDDQLSFLTRMLEACRMNVGDVAIVNHASSPVNSTALRQQLQPAVILLFGLEPTDIRLPMNFPPFKIQAYDACTYLCAPSLEELVKPGDESKLLKSKLWMCLKTLFEI